VIRLGNSRLYIVLNVTTGFLPERKRYSCSCV
jgi:hypothetical protein